MKNEGKQNKLKDFVKRILFNQYVEKGKKLSFWELEQYLIRAGFSYFIDSNGYKKLSIRRTIKPIHASIIKILDGIKKDRDTTIMILDNLIEGYKKGNVRYSYIRKFFRENKQFLTSKDISFYKKVIFELPKKNKKIILGD